MEAVSFSKFKDCLDAWNKKNELGAQCLSQQKPGQSSDDLSKVTNELKEVLDTMSQEYTTIVKQAGFQETLSNESIDIPNEITLLRNCLDMYDQEFMVKECIKGVASNQGFATQQHLSGSIALWKSESYLDDEIQLQIKQLK
ncbi:hypothetical protein EDC96DRAFT_465414 [Choanephora cucurbitarum]|nr:hypothetical protein EDC96DRAFT_465414 [Choanephora cucurbitarum]